MQIKLVSKILDFTDNRLLTFAYLAIRIFSYFFSSGGWANTVISMVIVGLVAALLIKKSPLAWIIITAELLFGGIGGFFQIFNISLRSVLLLISLSIYFVQTKTNPYKEKTGQFPIFLMIALTGFGLINGYFHHHSLKLALADAIPYLFLLYYFPLKQLLLDDKWKNFSYAALKSAILGEAIFIAFTFISFSTNWFILQNPYYHWFRDIAGGKITPVAYNFFRIVLNEQLLLIPILIYFYYLIIQKNNKKYYIFLTTSLFIYAFNLTRIYFLALFVGLTSLLTTKKWKIWLKVTLSSTIIFLTIFSGIYLLASGGKSFGLEVFGLRLQSIVNPTLEDSSLSRLLLLPKILDQIKAQPLLGVGLGSTITVFSPVQHTTITTSQYDWGYLEIISELGIIGLIIWFIFLFQIFKKLKKLPTNWQLASFFALLVINLTSPALFHVLGVVWLTFLRSSADVSTAQSLELSHKT